MLPEPHQDLRGVNVADQAERSLLVLNNTKETTCELLLRKVFRTYGRQETCDVAFLSCSCLPSCKGNHHSSASGCSWAKLIN